MSFSLDIKNEICHIESNELETIAELSGFVRNNYVLVDNTLKLNTENPKIARRVYSLLKTGFDISPVIVYEDIIMFNKKHNYCIEVSSNAQKLLKDLGVLDVNDKWLNTISDCYIETEEEKRAYLRGVFLAVGSINDPKKSRYHMEFSIRNRLEAEKLVELLKCFYLPSKILYRDHGYMVYIKEAEKIGDFLRVISANAAVLYFEDIRIYRDHKNMTNRLNNCEQANVDKIINMSNKQLKEISILEEKYDMELLDDKIRETVAYRKKYPEASLNELSVIISLETGKEITKSGLCHRFRKITELVAKKEKS